MKSTLIEIFGYIGSFLVLVSFLMTSVYKLRIVNTIGSLIFMIYALIIKSYPTAVMNFFLVLINVRFLWKMSHTGKEYDLVETKTDDGFCRYFLDSHREDILQFFPDQSFDFDKKDRAYLICHDSTPLGLTVGKLNGETLDLLLDYSVPEYRDFSIGSFLFEKLAEQGIKKVTWSGSTEKHLAYLESLNFIKKDGYYEKTL